MSSIPMTSSKDVGSYLEHELIETLPIEPVPDGDATWMDARVSHHISMGTVDLSDVLCLEAGTPVEIKGACIRINDGSDQTRRGRFYIKHDSHQQLFESGGVYCFVVYDREILATAWVRPETVDEIAGTWCEVDRAHGAVCKIPWSKVIPPRILEGVSA